MSIIVILCNEFPDLNFLKNEILEYQGVKDIYLFVRKTKTFTTKFSFKDSISQNIFFYDGYKKIFQLLSSAIKCLFWKGFYHEVSNLLKMRKFSLKALSQIFWDYNLGIWLSRYISNILKTREIDNNNIIFYTYRFSSLPSAVMLLKSQYKNSIYISRAHGYDLYEERMRGEYASFRRVFLDNLDKLYLISKNGYKYLAEKYPEHVEKFEISYLGSSDFYSFSTPSKISASHIITCSRPSIEKRLPLLSKILVEMDETITWTHIGDLADSKLSDDFFQIIYDNIKGSKVNFRKAGFLSSSEIKSLYSEIEGGIFVNVSSTEGIPVSIMEAMSAGFPIIATEAGGNVEAVRNEINGRIIPIDFEMKHFKEAYFDIIDEKKYKIYSTASRELWREKFNASSNYCKFWHKVECMSSNKKE